MSFALQEARLQRGSSRREGLVASALPMACLADAPSAPPVILVLSPVILVLSAACLADVFCRRPSCRCPSASTAGPRGEPPLCRYFAAVGCNLGLGLETCASAGARKGIRRFRRTLKGGATAPARRSTAPLESCSSCGHGYCGWENRRIKPVCI